MNTVGLLFGIVICMALGGWLAWETGKAIQTGTVNAGCIRHCKTTQPVRFWATVSIQLLFALTSIIVLLELLAQLGTVA